VADGDLTRDEAVERARTVAVGHQDVDLVLAGTGATFGSTTTIRFTCDRPGGCTFVDLVATTVHDVVLNGRSLDPAEVVTGSRVHLSGLAADNELVVRAECAYSHTGEGLHRFTDPADGLTYVYSQCSPANARRVFAVFEQPDLKAVFSLTVTAPADWLVVANAPTPDPHPVPADPAVPDERGTGGPRAIVWRFPPTQRMSSYLVAVVAGPFHHVHDTYDGPRGTVPLGLWCRRSVADHLEAEDLFAVTRQGLAFYEERFDCAYPFGKYDQLFLPEFTWGAVENIACVTFRDEFLYRSRQLASARQLRATVVLHELAHMWFGDLVTMRWWDDVWLNESFAEWAGQWSADAATRYTSAFLDAVLRTAWAHRADQLPSTHPVAGDIPDLEATATAFDGITYAKGAAVLRQLVAWVGEPAFLAGLRAHFTEHAYGNADFADLVRALESSSGRDLGGWSTRWLRTTGISVLRPVVSVDAAGRWDAFAVEQAVSGDDPTLRPHRLAVGLFDATPRGLVRRSRVVLDIDGPLTAVPELVGLPAADLVLLNDGDLTYAKVRFDARSLDTVLGRVADLEEPLARSVCWTALWDMTRDAELPATRWVRTVLAGLATETGIAAVQLLLGQGASAVESFVAPAAQDAARDEWAAGLGALLTAAAPGSDHQLAFARGLARSPGNSTGLDLLTGLLDGSRSLSGLVVDVDLRWSLVLALARAGRWGHGDVAVELARDDTVAGREAAAAARAALPDAAAKAAAWRDAVERDDVSNETQVALTVGFHQPGQEEVLAPYVDRYFAAATDVWVTRTPTMAANVLTGLFPRFAPAEQVLAAARRWSATTTAGPAARRLVSEGCADAELALAAQELDARSAREGPHR